jgi:hypothetical protein
LFLLPVIIPPYHAPKRMILSESDSNDNDNDDAFDNDMMSLGNTSKVIYSNNNDTNENGGRDQSELTFYHPPTMINTKHGETHISNVNWEGDESMDPNPPKVPFKESSDRMNRHAEIYIIKPKGYNYYNNSDGGRRKKVTDTAFDVCNTSESEYESVEEDLYYDPRQLSKWKWETDYTSIQASDYDSSSTKSDDELSYKESIGKKIKIGKII